jgi:2-methylcitrate dehydratase PrpD
LLNGAAGHALDYDDVNLSMPGHPSVAILPGLIALAESQRACGRDLVTAFVAGYETACRLGAALSPGHYDRGFHSTGTIGSFGSRRGLRPSSRSRCGRDGDRARHRRHPGGRAEVAIRHDV